MRYLLIMSVVLHRFYCFLDIISDSAQGNRSDIWGEYVEQLKSSLEKRIQDSVRDDKTIYSGMTLESIFTPLTLELEQKLDDHEHWLDFEGAEAIDKPEVDPVDMFENISEGHNREISLRNDQPHCVLVKGPAGIGKTTLLLNLILKWKKGEMWNEKFDAVYLFQFRKLNQMLEKEVDVIDLLTGYHPPNVNPDAITENLLYSKKKILLCFDGLDEFRGFDGVQPRDYPDISGKTPAQLPCLLYNLWRGSILKNAHFVITSRPTAATHLSIFERVLEIQGFSPTQRFDYIHNVCKMKCDKSTSFEQKIINHQRLHPETNRFSPLQFLSNSIRKYLTNQPNVFSLMYLPLLSSFICELLPRIILGDGKLRMPVETTTQVFVQLVLIFVRSRHKTPAVDNQEIHNPFEVLTSDHSQLQIRKLCKLAMCGIVSKDEPAKYVFYESQLKEQKFDLTEGDIKLGFLKQGISQTDDLFDTEDRALEFLHLTIQEFFTAVELIVTWSKNKEQIKMMINDPMAGKYEMVLFFMAGLLGDRKCFKFIERIQSDDESANLICDREERLTWLFKEMNDSFLGGKFSNKEEKMMRKRILLMTYESQLSSLIDKPLTIIVGKGTLVLDSFRLFPSDMQAISHFLNLQHKRPAAIG